MKTIKKGICFILSLLLLCLAAVIPAGAALPMTLEEVVIRDKFIDYLDEAGIEHGYNFPEGGWFDTTVIKFMTDSNGWNVFSGTPGYYPGDPGFVPDFGFMSEQFDNYVIISYGYMVPYKLGVYAEKDGVILNLEEAFNQNKINIGDVAQVCYEHEGEYLFPTARRIGDTNKDNKISIADVLDLQKFIAREIADFDKHTYPDYNQDESVNLKDVIDMQKSIAKLNLKLGC